MPSFLKDLRRKSRTGSIFSLDRGSSSNGSTKENRLPNSKSSSTLDYTSGSTTPPSTIPSESSEPNSKAANGEGPPSVPNHSRPGTARPTNGNSRYSMA
ncbi:hypothetical protein LTS18_007551, partial [Coniosporium uncinatum]